VTPPKSVLRVGLSTTPQPVTMYQGETLAFALMPRKAQRSFPAAEYGTIGSRMNAPASAIIARIPIMPRFKTYIVAWLRRIFS
jgi:hypothetical protein